MPSSPAQQPLPSAPWVGFGLLWLAGVGLRSPLLAVPPLLPAIHRDISLSETAVGLLTGIPILTFMLTTVLGSWLVARAGARRALVIGCSAVACAGGMRGLSRSEGILFTCTVLMGVGIAVSQPALPTLARAWHPTRTGLATAIYTNGLLIGEIIPAALTAPILISLFGLGWGWSFFVWSMPAALAVLCLLAFAPPDEPLRVGTPSRWWPDWRSWTTWRLGLILGCASLTYYSANTFIPEYLRSRHHAGLIAPALTSLNLTQLPASFLVTALPGRLVGKRAPIMGSAALILAATIGLLICDPSLTVAFAGLIGFAAGLVFILSLAMPALISDAGDVHRLTAGMLTITFACGFAGPLLGGVLWDTSNIAALAFAPVMASSAAMFALGQRLGAGAGRGA